MRVKLPFYRIKPNCCHIMLRRAIFQANEAISEGIYNPKIMANANTFVSRKRDRFIQLSLMGAPMGDGTVIYSVRNSKCPQYQLRFEQIFAISGCGMSAL